MTWPDLTKPVEQMSPEEIDEASRRARAGDEDYANRERAGRLTEKKTDEELETTLGGEIRGKWKIEVHFLGPDESINYKGRTIQGPNWVKVMLWESGKRFHGGGDEQAFWCLDATGELGCGGLIPSDCVRGGVAVCPKCNRAINHEQLAEGRVGLFSSRALSVELEKLFRQLNSNSDIYLKYHKTDPHYIAMERARGPEVAARLKGMAIYPLKNIIKDTSSGASVQKRFYAFVCS